MLTHFRLEIAMGNDAMQSPSDVAQALRAVSESLEYAEADGPHPIRDLNGNTVGQWELMESRTLDSDLAEDR